MSAKTNRIDDNIGTQGAGGGPNDIDSGGTGSGVPDAEAAARAGEDINKGDVAIDRQRVSGDVAGMPSHKKIDPG